MPGLHHGTGQYGLTPEQAPQSIHYTMELNYGIPITRRQELLNLYLRRRHHASGNDSAAGFNFGRGYFSTGYELVKQPFPGAKLEHRGFVRYQREF